MSTIQSLRDISEKPTSDPEFAKDLIDWLVDAGYTLVEECGVTHNPGSPLEIYSENAEVRLKLTRVK